MSVAFYDSESSWLDSKIQFRSKEQNYFFHLFILYLFQLYINHPVQFYTTHSKFLNIVRVHQYKITV